MLNFYYYSCDKRAFKMCLNFKDHFHICVKKSYSVFRQSLWMSLSLFCVSKALSESIAKVCLSDAHQLNEFKNKIFCLLFFYIWELLNPRQSYTIIIVFSLFILQTCSNVHRRSLDVTFSLKYIEVLFLLATLIEIVVEISVFPVWFRKLETGCRRRIFEYCSENK